MTLVSYRITTALTKTVLLETASRDLFDAALTLLFRDLNNDYGLFGESFIVTITKTVSGEAASEWLRGFTA